MERLRGARIGFLILNLSLLFFQCLRPINRGTRPALLVVIRKANSSHRETAISSSYRPGVSRRPYRASNIIGVIILVRQTGVGGALGEPKP
jgi:hypothetical protein